MGGRPRGEVEVGLMLPCFGCSRWKIERPEGFEALEVVVAIEHYIPPAPYPLYHQRVKNQHEAHDP